MGNACYSGGSTLDPMLEKHKQDGALEELPEHMQNDAGPLDDIDQFIEDVQEKNLEQLRLDFKHNYERFLLNNILFSVQFFTHYEREKESLKKNQQERENECDTALDLNGGRMNCIYTGTIYEGAISRGAARYQSKRNGVAQSLHALEHFLTTDAVEVHEGNQFSELAAYTELDPHVYRMCMEDTKRPGFVRLRCVDIPNKDTKNQEACEDNESEGYSRYSDYGDLKRNNNDDYAPNEEDEEDRLTPSPEMVTKREETPTISSEHHFNYSDSPESKLSTGAQFLQQLKNTIQSGQHQHSSNEDNTSERQANENEFSAGHVQLHMPNGVFTGRRSSGVMPLNYPTARTFKKKPPKLHIPSSVNSYHASPANNQHQPVQERQKKPDGTRLDSPTRPKTISYKLPNGTSLQQTGSFSSVTSRASSAYNSQPRLQPLDSISSDSEYSYYQESPSGRPLVRSGSSSALSKPFDSKNGIPLACFHKVQVPVHGSYDSSSEEDDLESDYQIKTYFSSAEYMCRFEKKIHDLVPALELGDSLQEASIIEPWFLFPVSWNKPATVPLVVTYAFAPAISVHFWPCVEWQLRNRKRIVDKRTNIIYSWPSKRQVDMITRCGCNLIPIKPTKTGINVKDAIIEWELSFPRAELALLSTVTHPQMRCYIFCLLIHKTFLDPINAMDTYYWKTALFWLLEQNYVGWSDENLGKSLQRMLLLVYQWLMKESMPHYFIRKRNLLQNVSRGHLRRIQEKIKRIREHIVPHILYALRNLRMPQEPFYPMPDFKQLYSILTEEWQDQLKKVNPDLLQTAGCLEADIQEEEEQQHMEQPVEQRKDYSRERKRRQWAKYQEEQRQKTRQQRTSVESVNFDAKLQPLNPMRKKLVLEFFAEHFVNMAKKSNEFRATAQSAMYLQHVSNLAQLMEDEGYHEPAVEVRAEITKISAANPHAYREYIHARWGINEALMKDTNWELRMMPLPQVPVSPAGKSPKTPKTPSSLGEKSPWSPKTPKTPDQKSPNAPKTPEKKSPNRPNPTSQKLEKSSKYIKATTKAVIESPPKDLDNPDVPRNPQVEFITLEECEGESTDM